MTESTISRSAENRVEEKASMTKPAGEIGSPPSGAGDDGSGRIDRARRYLEGDGVPQNFARALDLISPSSSKGAPEARYLLALIHADGLGTAKDVARAHLEASLAAAQGHGEATDLLDRLEAGMTAEDLARAQDAAAAAWETLSGATAATGRRTAAMGGDLDAMSSLAGSYFHGTGSPRHYARAYLWASLAAAAGNRMARGIRDRVLGAMEAGVVTPDGILAAQARAAELWDRHIGPALKARLKGR
jgi:TPR repeat protein